MKIKSIKAKLLLSIIMPAILFTGCYFFTANIFSQMQVEFGSQFKSHYVDKKIDEKQLNINLTKVVTEKKLSLLALLIIGIGFLFISTIVIANLVSSQVKRVSLILLGITEKVDNSSQLLSENNQSFEKSVSSQASSLQETVASIDEISSMVQKNADAAKHSTTVSHSSKEAAEKGKKAVEDMISEINGISESNKNIMVEMQRSNEEMSRVVCVIKEIENKTKVINDIVFQTKLLSFNASVEAARAGEHGKGFAVVAEEVGNLASMSGTAALEISEMLETSTKQVQGIVEDSKSNLDSLVKSGKEKVESGIKVANICDESLDEILKNVNSVNELIQEISVASSEQSTGVREVTRSMQALDLTTQTNSTLATESADLSKTLEGQAGELSLSISSLMKIVSGNSDKLEKPIKTKTSKRKKGKSNIINFKMNEGKKSVVEIKKIVNAPNPAETTESDKDEDYEDMPDFNDPRFEDL